MKKKKMKIKRACGGCTACCLIVLDIDELEKPLGQWCQYCEKGVGCQIYAKRPHNCRGFVCQWLLGGGEESERPDKGGYILDYCGEWLEGKDDKHKLLQIWEVEEGKLNLYLPKIWQLTKQATDAGIFVSHIYLSGRKVVFVPNTISLSKIKAEGFEIKMFPK